MTNRLLLGAAFAAGWCFACNIAPSRAPLGGNYSLPESAPARDRHATPAALASTQTDAADPGPQTPTTAPSSVPSVAAGAALQAVSTTDSIHFEPLQVGSRIKADVT